MIFIIYLSFSTVYGTYIWYFMVVLKVFQIMYEEWLKLHVISELKLNLLSVLICKIYTFTIFVSVQILI